MTPSIAQERSGYWALFSVLTLPYATRAEVYFRQFAIDYYTRLALEIPKNEARLVNTDSMRNCINWR